MSEPIKKPNQIPESYNPKTPEIANVMKQAEMEIKEIPPQYMIDTTFPTGDNPWTGGCDYLRCFSSMYMHLEGMPPAHDTQYWLYRKFMAVTSMGMITTFTDAPDGHNYTFEAANDYIRRSHQFVGYDYHVIEAARVKEDELFKIISRSIFNSRPVLAVLKGTGPSYKFNRQWHLFIGYDHENMALSINENGTASALKDWFENLDRVIIITKTGLPRSDMKDVLQEIINDVERKKSLDEDYGHAAYETLIAKLDDDAYFKNADDETLEQFNKALGTFYWCHAETRGATGEGYGLLCGRNELKNGELEGTEYQSEVNYNGFYGYNGHQTSYIGCMAIKRGGGALRSRSQREELIFALRMLMSNDAKIIESLKRALKISTPNVMYPKNEIGNAVDYCYRTTDKSDGYHQSIEHMNITNPPTITKIIQECKAINTYTVDLKNDLISENIEYNFINNDISVKGGGNVWESNGWLCTENNFKLPIKIDARIINNGETSFGLKYGGGYIKSASWGKKSGRCVIRDPYTAFAMDFDLSGFPPEDYAELDISWIIQCDFIAIIVNGQLMTYIENYPYTHFDVSASPVGIGTFDYKTVTVKSLAISELE